MIKGVILDLDGTVYVGHDEVPGAARFLQDLAGWGLRRLFVTNRSNRTPAQVCEQLRRYGIACVEDDILTSAEATARYLREGSVYCIGEEGLFDALRRAGLLLTDRSPEYVVVGFDREFTYVKLKKACRLIEAGARFVATNPDRALHTENGIVPGTGALVAAVAAGCGVEPEVVGKPGKRIIEMGLERLGLEPAETLVAGDNLTTDIPAGAGAGAPTALLLTGVSKRADTGGAAVQPTWVAADYGELTRILMRENGL